MKRYLVFFAIIAVALIGYMAATALAHDPPGRDPCGHGATNKPCRTDPSTNGKDCDHHGKHGGVNEDHCKGTTTTPTTTTYPTTSTPHTTTGATTTSPVTTTSPTTTQTIPSTTTTQVTVPTTTTVQVTTTVPVTTT